MAFQTLFANSTAQQSLLNGDEFVLGAGVTLAVDNDALIGTGSTETALFGDVFATNGSAYRISNGGNTVLTVGQAANVVSTGGSAVSVFSASTIDIHNAGVLSAMINTAVYLSGTAADANVTIDFINTGAVLSGNVGVFAYSGSQPITFENSGSIHGRVIGVYLDGDLNAIHFDNAGTITGVNSHGVEFGGSAPVDGLNTGTISSTNETALVFGVAGGVFSNSGTIASGAGDAVDTTGALTLRNSGTILGDVRFGAGNDTFSGRKGTVEGGVFGGGGDDILIGSRSDDILFGDADADSLYGHGEDDTLFGGTGDDFLFGNRGDDLLIGGAGLDTLRGGAGADTFLFENGDSGLRGAADVIADFTRRADKIDLSAFGGLDFIGAGRFSGGGTGELRLRVLRQTDTQLQLDTDGDGRADLHILVADTTRLAEADFIL